MRSKEKLFKILLDIYQEIYKNSNPPSDFKKMIESGETKQENFFLKYYIPEDKLEDIIEDMLKKFKCTKTEKRILRESLYLGAVPTSSKEVWNKHKNKASICM